MGEESREEGEAGGRLEGRDHLLCATRGTALRTHSTEAEAEAGAGAGAGAGAEAEANTVTDTETDADTRHQTPNTKHQRPDQRKLEMKGTGVSFSRVLPVEWSRTKSPWRVPPPRCTL